MLSHSEQGYSRYRALRSLSLPGGETVGELSDAPGKCIVVTASQVVMFTNVDNVHPLHLDCGPALPITSTQTAPFSRMFSTPGLYGLRCTNSSHPANATGLLHGLAISVP